MVKKLKKKAKPHVKKQVRAHKKPTKKRAARSRATSIRKPAHNTLHAKIARKHLITPSAAPFDEKSCGVVLFFNDEGIRKYLILHYLGGHFDFPKGHVEKREDEKATVKREVEEETGIKDVKFYPQFREEVSYEYLRDARISKKQVIFYLGETKTTQITLSHEHKNFMWLDYDDALAKLTYENAKHLLFKADRYFL
ncbi:MAG: NUDIX domain-containing protein [Candidatus Gracilibacteria bacterium]|jgi:8-oxo-dGTP pyrophosphatase MutT (NUDIX family)